jgi:nucleotide-binding universal stress UspA family protein
MSSSTNEKAIFYKILVAIDSSDASMDAADYATASCGSSGCKIGCFVLAITLTGLFRSKRAAPAGLF